MVTVVQQITSLTRRDFLFNSCLRLFMERRIYSEVFKSSLNAALFQAKLIP